MATLIQGFTCQGCGRFHKYPQGFAALRVEYDMTDEGLVILAVRQLRDSCGRTYHVVEHNILVAAPT
jgi:hypothetical protein